MRRPLPNALVEPTIAVSQVQAQPANHPSAGRKKQRHVPTLTGLPQAVLSFFQTKETKVYLSLCRSRCTLYASPVRPRCALYAPSMCSLCALCALSMRPPCAIYASPLRPQHAKDPICPVPSAHSTHSALGKPGACCTQFRGLAIPLGTTNSASVTGRMELMALSMEALICDASCRWK